jgi:hypothetical protein
MTKGATMINSSTSNKGVSQAAPMGSNPRSREQLLGIG